MVLQASCGFAKVATPTLHPLSAGVNHSVLNSY